MTTLKLHAALFLFSLIVGATAPMSSTSAATVDEIKARGTLIVGAEAVVPPFVYREGNAIVGFEADVAAHVADKLGVKLEILDTSWSGLLPALIVGKLDTVMSGMTITKERLNKVDFSAPYTIAKQGVLVRADSSINAARDLAGKRLGYPIGSPDFQNLKDYSQQLQSEGLQPIEIPLYESPADILADLKNRRLDAAMSKIVTLRLQLKTLPEGEFRIVPLSDIEQINRFTNVSGAAVAKGNESLLTFINETLQEMRDSGKLNELHMKWLGGSMDVPATIPDNIP